MTLSAGIISFTGAFPFAKPYPRAWRRIKEARAFVTRDLHFACHAPGEVVPVITNTQVCFHLDVIEADVV